MLSTGNRFSWVALPILAVLLSIGIVAAIGKTSSVPATTDTVIPASVPQFSLGIPAIPTSGGSSTTANSSTLDAQTVWNYARTHRVAHNLSGEQHSVVSVQLLTSKALSAKLGGESIGLADDSPVYYVELQGVFTFKGPNGTSVTFSKGYEVFDAHSGNLIIWGGHP